MIQAALNFSRPDPDHLFKPGSQNHRIYCRLLCGPVTNSEIVREMNVFNSTGRCADIRKALRPYLLDVSARRIGLRRHALRQGAQAAGGARTGVGGKGDGVVLALGGGAVMKYATETKQEHRIVAWIVKRFCPGFHLSKNPVRKERRDAGEAKYPVHDE